MKDKLEIAVKVILWNGESDLANQHFGDHYGKDWEYLESSKDIVVDGLITKVGEPLPVSRRIQEQMEVHIFGDSETGNTYVGWIKDIKGIVAEGESDEIVRKKLYALYTIKTKYDYLIRQKI